MASTNVPNFARLPELVKFNRGKVGYEEPLPVFGSEVYIKITGAQTGGAWSMIEQVTPPAGGSPVHSHSREDECFSVVEGDFLFMVGEERIAAHPGDFLFAPRNLPHSYRNIGSIPGRLAVILSPSGMEEFFLEAASLEGQPTLGQIGALFAKYGLEILGPPMTI